MFAQAIDITGAGRFGCHEGLDLRELWREMSGGRGGGPREYGEGRGGPRGRHGGHRRHGRSGPGPGFGGQFGGYGPRGWGGRGRKARRGDIRTAALLLLAEEPRNGYQIMQEVEERSDGVWRPSPGSVYPALQQLEDEGLIRSEEIDGRKLFRLTDAGRAQVDERDPEARAPWEQTGADYGDQVFVAKAMKEIAFAFAQLMRSGSDEQLSKARDVLAVTRRDLYRILADEDPGEDVRDDDAGATGDEPAAEGNV